MFFDYKDIIRDEFELGTIGTKYFSFDTNLLFYLLLIFI